jgi:hypothetical protein
MSLVPEQRRLIGVILLVVGIVSLVMTAGIVTMIINSRAEAAERFTEAQASCKRRLSALGGKVDEVPGRLIWVKENIQEAPARLGEASVAAVLCPGWKLRTACVGTECSDANAMRVVLEPMNDPVEE